jgi:hypothetical protein
MTQGFLQTVEAGWEVIFPFVPAILYSLLCTLTWTRQLQMIPHKFYPLLDDRVTTNLTLAGFAFTVTGFTWYAISRIR